MGASISYLMRAFALVSMFPANLDAELLQYLYDICLLELQVLVPCRHPEPSLASRLSVVDSTIHVYGSWKKLHLDKPGGVSRRFGSSAFIYDGHLYVLGGEKDTNRGPYYFDFWRINLQRLDGWQRLPDCPIPRSRTRSISNQNIAVWDDTAYYFSGSRMLYSFDLISVEWSSIATTFKSDGVITGPWPYLREDLNESTMTCADGRLYVFGGYRSDCMQGCDLFLELDLNERQWRRLSGSPHLSNASLVSPGPRVSAISWVAPDQSRIFIGYGHVNRIASRAFAPTELERRGGHNYAYDDVWSWHIKDETWRRVSVAGNAPGPRSEMAAAYSPKLDKLVVFGGYSPASPHWTGGKTIRLYSYLADTFLCDVDGAEATTPERLSNDAAKPQIDRTEWRQVITRGFPTYRARASLVEDPASGKIYLFSGYFEQEFLPSLEVKMLL